MPYFVKRPFTYLIHALSSHSHKRQVVHSYYFISHDLPLNVSKHPAVICPLCLNTTSLREKFFENATDCILIQILRQCKQLISRLLISLKLTSLPSLSKINLNMTNLSCSANIDLEMNINLDSTLLASTMKLCLHQPMKFNSVQDPRSHHHHHHCNQG